MCLSSIRYTCEAQLSKTERNFFTCSFWQLWDWVCQCVCALFCSYGYICMWFLMKNDVIVFDTVYCVTAIAIVFLLEREHWTMISFFLPTHFWTLLTLYLTNHHLKISWNYACNSRQMTNLHSITMRLCWCTKIYLDIEMNCAQRKENWHWIEFKFNCILFFLEIKLDDNWHKGNHNLNKITTHCFSLFSSNSLFSAAIPIRFFLRFSLNLYSIHNLIKFLCIHIQLIHFLWKRIFELNPTAIISESETLHRNNEINPYWKNVCIHDQLQSSTSLCVQTFEKGELYSDKILKIEGQ